jgi:hypothetical protein
MQPEREAHIVFHLSGKRRAAGLDAFDPTGTRPALFAGYRDLTRLRYDFPLVLTAGGQSAMQPMSAVIDELIEHLDGQGELGGGTRQRLLRLEQEIRSLLAAGESGTLSQLWERAARRLQPDNPVEGELERARAALRIDGELVDCNADLPGRLFVHVWRQVQDGRVARLRREVGRLIRGLSDILRADFVRSEAGRSAAALEAAVGAGFAHTFDFDKLSGLLTRAAPKAALKESHRLRIGHLLSVLESHRLFTLRPEAGAGADAIKPHSFVFDDCASALKAYRDRLPAVIELAKAISMSELEIKGEYVAAKHDPFFDEFGEHMLSARHLSLLPDYLVRLNAAELKSAANAELPDILAAGLPMKVVVQSDDILEPAAIGEGHLAFGVANRQLTSMAMGMNQVFVLQASASQLHRTRERVAAGLKYSGPAVFSVYSGGAGGANGLPPYLMAAAAVEARAFPTFSYDPAAGADWASRLSLEGNPQAERDWPVHEFSYQDEAYQRVTEEVAFTFIDFVACDRRYAQRFAKVPRQIWNGNMMSVPECIEQDVEGLPEKVPALLMVDGEDRLQKIIVDDKLVREARGCLQMWRSLQELGGIHNSHAQRLLAQARAEWQAQQAIAVAAAQASAPLPETPAVAAAEAVAQAPAGETAVAEQAAAPSPDEPYIETPRCTTCEECMQINDKMFVYDGNKQAYIADLKAGTYRQMVEAAESCQVAIIHPGKPWNPDEPGLEELIARAQDFA